VVINASGEQDMPTLVDARGNTSYLREASALNAIIRLGPVVEPKESLLLRMLPPLFYLSIFVVVGIWLRPLLRDINLITHGAQRFAADYREPLRTADSTTELTGLARNLDDMSTRLSGLIQSQKELIAALSHEMRTPLARIRFALAIIGNKSGTELKEPLDEPDRLDAELRPARSPGFAHELAASSGQPMARADCGQMPPGGHRYHCCDG
jgi:signal transduction histidine kinase